MRVSWGLGFAVERLWIYSALLGLGVASIRSLEACENLPRRFDSDSAVDISTLWELLLESKACASTRPDGSVSGQALPMVGVRRRFEVNLIAHSKALELLPTYPFGYTLLRGSPDGFPDGGL